MCSLKNTPTLPPSSEKDLAAFTLVLAELFSLDSRSLLSILCARAKAREKLIGYQKTGPRTLNKVKVDPKTLI